MENGSRREWKTPRQVNAYILEFVFRIMRIVVKTRLECVKPKIEKFDRDKYLVYLVSLDYKDGNEELIHMLSKYFGTPPSRIEIVQGAGTSEKVLEIS